MVRVASIEDVVSGDSLNGHLITALQHPTYQSDSISLSPKARRQVPLG